MKASPSNPPTLRHSLRYVWLALAGVVALAVALPTVAQEQSVGQPINLFPDDEDIQDEGAAETGLPEEVTYAREKKGIEVNVLEDIGPKAAGVEVTDPGSLGYDFWRGSSRGRIETLLGQVPGDLASPALRDLLRRLLASDVSPPQTQVASQDSGSGAGDFLATRAQALFGLGEIASMNALLEGPFGAAGDEYLDRLRLEGLLLAGNNKAACDGFRQGVAAYSDPFWDKGVVFCQLTSGESVQAQLGLDLMRETGETDDEFLALAQQFQGGEAAPFTGSRLTPLTFAMLMALDQSVPDSTLANAPPPYWNALVPAKGAGLDARAALAEKTVGRGMLDGRTLAGIYGEYSFSGADLRNALSVLASAEAVPDRAQLYLAAQNEREMDFRADILQGGLKLAQGSGAYLAFVRAVEEMVRGIPVRFELMWSGASLGRALFALGRYEQGGAWLGMARQDPSLSAVAARTENGLWPLARLAGYERLSGPDAQFGLSNWFEERRLEDENAIKNLLFLLACFEALGEPVPWDFDQLPETAFEKPSIDPDVLSELSEASFAGLKGETALLAAIAVGSAPTGKIDTVSFSTILGALQRAGLGPDARALAVEAALLRGI